MATKARVKEEPKDSVKEEPMEVEERIVKAEVVDDQAAENEVFRLIELNTDGISMEHLSVLLPAVTQQQKQNVINALLTSRRVVMMKEMTRDGQASIRVKVNDSTQLDGVSEEEQAVYSLIEESKTKGIWIKELRDNTGLTVSQMRKALKSMENKKLIKTVKAVNTTRKCYMLYNLEPDTSLTGGTFYSDHQLDSELIHTLVSVCTSYLQSKKKFVAEAHPNDAGLQKELSFVRAQDVANYIAEKGVLTVSISLEDVERILDVAILDGTVERRADGKVRATPVQHFVSPLACIPCGICPLINDCKPGHVISPESCQYMSEWLSGK